MISLLIAQPAKRESNIKCPPPPPKRIFRELVPRSTQTFDDFNRDEESYVFKLIASFFVFLILPAILTLLYLALNPEAFAIDTPPKIDFSTWQP